MSKPIVGRILDNISVLSALQEAIQTFISFYLKWELMVASALKMPHRAIRLWGKLIKA